MWLSQRVFIETTSPCSPRDMPPIELNLANCSITGSGRHCSMSFRAPARSPFFNSSCDSWKIPCVSKNVAMNSSSPR